mmetsp:Transcript_93865/g.223249  ORF Transcript_93865/g.223249 Transcript_93865/m.223249 type:complete len:704 (-) Transcript_93865:1228-3339(-)
MTSFCSFWATYLCSWSLRVLFCLSREVSILVRFSSCLLMSSKRFGGPLPFLASRCLDSSSFCAEVTEVRASCWALPTFSQLDFTWSAGSSAAPSGFSSSASDWMSFASSAVASSASCTFFSASMTFPSTSFFTKSCFCSFMAFLLSDRVFVSSSRRVTTTFSCSSAAFFGASARRRAASFFTPTKVLAPLSACVAACAAPSNADSDSETCSAGISCSALKGFSASSSFFMASSTSLTRCSESLTMLSTMAFSERSRMPDTVLSKLCWSSSRRGFSFSTSFEAAGWILICMSVKRMADFRAACISAAAASASFRAFCTFSLLSLLISGSLPSSLSFSPSMASDSSVSRSNFCSTAFTLAEQSSMAFFAASRDSTDAEIFLYLPISVATARNLASYLMSSLLISDEASLPLASICLVVINFLVSAKCLVAACSALIVASEAARTSSELSWANFSSSRGSAALATSLARSSAFFTSCSASLTVTAFFRSAVDFFSSLSLLVWVSKSDWKAFSFVWASFPSSGVNRFASTSFVAMNMRAMEAAVLAAVDAVSTAFTAASVSSRGSSSTPMRKGPSASAALDTVSATVASFSLASFTKTSRPTRSEASFWELFRSARRCTDCLARSSILDSSSLARPTAVFFLVSIKRMTAPMWSPALATACCACTINSLDKPSCFSISVASSARSTSTSAGESFSSTSCIIFCAAVL